MDVLKSSSAIPLDREGPLLTQIWIDIAVSSAFHKFKKEIVKWYTVISARIDGMNSLREGGLPLSFLSSRLNVFIGQG